MATLDEYDLRRFEKSKKISKFNGNSSKHNDNKDFGLETEQHLENLILTKKQNSRDKEARNFTFARKISERKLNIVNPQFEIVHENHSKPVEYKKDQKSDVY